MESFIPCRNFITGNSANLNFTFTPGILLTSAPLTVSNTSYIKEPFFKLVPFKS